MTATSQDRFHALISCPIVKQDVEKRLVTGVVLQPGVEDAHGDVVSAEVIEDAAHQFVAKYNAATELGVQHKLFGLPDIHLVESYLAPEDMVIGGQNVLKGTWIMTVKVLNDEVWNGVKNGDLTGFSIGATATVPADPGVQVEEDGAAAEWVAKEAGASMATKDVAKARPLLKLDVNEVSLVDAAANERQFLVTKSKVQDPLQESPTMAKKPIVFTINTNVAKDMGKIKSLSKELALERLGLATSMIEQLKANFEGFTDISQLWKAVDDIHAMLWPVEGDIATAVFKSLGEGEAAITLTVSDAAKEAIAKAIEEVKGADAEVQAQAIAKAISEAMTLDAVEKFITEQTAAVKAKSVTPKRLANLASLAQGLLDAVGEMSPEPEEEPATEQADIAKTLSAILDSKLDPVVKRLDALEAATKPAEPATEPAEVQKAKVEQELAKAKADAEAAQQREAALKKQLQELEAGTSGTEETTAPPDPETVSVKKGLWHGVIHQPTIKARRAAQVAAETAKQ